MSGTPFSVGWWTERQLFVSMQPSNGLTGSDSVRVNGLIKVAPGEFVVSRQPAQLVTVLGSCVAACLYDPLMRVGGMNHFMLPIRAGGGSRQWGKGASDINRFGNFAMESLINGVISAGGDRRRMQVKLFGGGKVLDISANVGAANAEFALEYLEMEGIAVESMDLGKDYARKVLFEPHTGRARMKKLREVYNGLVVKTEKELIAGSNGQTRGRLGGAFLKWLISIGNGCSSSMIRRPCAAFFATYCSATPR